MNEPIAGTDADTRADHPSGITSSRDSRRASRARPADPRTLISSGQPMDVAELVEMLCLDQVERWRLGERIPAEAYLALHPTLSAGGEAAFELVYGEYLIRESLGEPPRLEEFLWRFPAFADRLRRQVALHRALGDAPTRIQRDPDDDPPADRPDDEVPIVPGYDVLGILGQGGMSVVYLARQAALNRLVALKLIRARVYSQPEVAARFRDEAEAAARFQHPNIVHVYEVGVFEGQGYLVLEYAAGGSLQQKLAGNPQPPRAAAETVERLARALHYAHERGIVHRDMKPANVVLTEDGVPKVTDFGLAKLMGRDEGLTRTGDIMGTPSYMAPEQARGTSSDVTAAADIYALGAILYEMLTGRPPFKGATPLSTLSQVVEQEVVPPGRLQRHLPREVETICLKCLEKEPRKRYASALDLADDLRRYQENRPILARRISRAEWLWRWCRREPVKAVLATSLVVAIIAGFLGVAAQGRRAAEKARDEALARDRAESAEGRALDNLYSTRIARARLEWRLSDLVVARQQLDACDPGRRDWEWYYLDRLNHSELLNFEVPPGMPFIASVAFNRDGSRLAFSAFDPYENPKSQHHDPVEVWQTYPPRRLWKLEVPHLPALVVFSPDGRYLAASGNDGAHLLDAATGEVVRSWPRSGAASFSPDGRTLVSCRDQRVTFRDVSTGTAVRDFAAEDGRVTFRPDGRVVAVSGRAAVVLHDAATGKVLRRLPHGPSDHTMRQSRFFGEEGPDLAFSPDGTLLAVTTDPPRVWDVADGSLRLQLGGHDGTVQGIAFSPDGRYVATAGVDSTIRIWDSSSGVEHAVLRGHSSWVGCLAFHPEGWCLLSGGRDASEVKLWDLTRHPEYVSLRGNLPSALVFEPDGASLRVLIDGGRLYRRDPNGATTEVGPLVDLTQEWLTPAVLAEFSADARRLATVAVDRKLIKVYDAAPGRELATLRGLSLPATRVSISRDGSRVAASGFDSALDREHHDVKVWDVATGRVLAAFHPALPPTRGLRGQVALDPDGTHVAIDELDRDDATAGPGKPALPRHAIQIHEVIGGSALARFTMPDETRIYSLAFSPDGRRLAAGGESGTVRIWDVATGKLLNSARWDEESYALRFSPDGHRLAGVSRNRVQVRDAGDGREILILRGAPARWYDGGFNPVMAWSPDGAELAATNWDHTISVWTGARSPVPPDRRWTIARSRIFAWNLDEAEAAIEASRPEQAGHHLDVLLGMEPPDMRSRLKRAAIASKLRRFGQADDDYKRWLADGGPQHQQAWMACARVRLANGDLAGYRTLCSRMLEVLARDADLSLAREAPRVFVLGPCTVAQAERVLERVEPALSHPAEGTGSMLLLGMLRFRAGQWEAARTALERFIERDPNSSWMAFPLLAIVQHELGRDREAADWLARATQRLERQRNDSVGGHRFFDGLWFEQERLTSEAAALIRPPTR